MPIVAYGYGLESAAIALTSDVILSLDAEPDITVDDDIVIVAPTDDVIVSVDPDIDIEVE